MTMKYEKNTRDSSLNRFCQAALNYSEKFGFSVIPVKLNKKSYIKWEPFQRRRATKEEIREWWNRWPNAMIGIVTGSISGVVVIDVDTEEGQEAISEYIPDTLLMPTCTTPKGGKHLYFKAPEKPLSNNTRIIPGCDFRGEGGYVIAPPSVNETGGAYVWLEGLSVNEIEPPSLPCSYINYLINYSKQGQCIERDGNVVDGRQKSSNVVKMFTEGRRDEDLFHIANLLVKGRMPYDQIKQVLEKLAKSCEPPFPLKEISTKIESALKRAERRERNLAEEAREWVLSSSGVFLSSEIAQGLQVSSREEQKNLSKILSRFCEEGLIERHGNKNGCFRRVEKECEEIDIFNVGNDGPIDIHWPFKIERYVLTMPKTIIVVAGEPDSGKTAFLLNTVLLNISLRKIHYFSSEMGKLELRTRLEKFEVPLETWSKVDFRERETNFADVIHPDDINFIDFLELHEDFWKISKMIMEIWSKLKTGVSIIALQKDKQKEFGRGGIGSLEKPRLYLTMESGYPCKKIKILKAKNWATEVRPAGLELSFKLVQGCKFLPEGDWHR